MRSISEDEARVAATALKNNEDVYQKLADKLKCSRKEAKKKYYIYLYSAEYGPRKD